MWVLLISGVGMVVRDVEQLLTPEALPGSAHLPSGAPCEVKSLSPETNNF